MVTYRCICCNYTVSNKQAYERHLKTKKHTAVLEGQTKDGDLDAFIKHVKSQFEVLEDKIEQKNEELILVHRAYIEKIDKLESKNKELMSRIEKLEDMKQEFIGSVHNGNIDNSNHYHIHLGLTKYGAESYPDDTKALSDAIRGVNKVIPSLVKLRHFDARHPENQNIKIPNKKQNKIQIYDGQRWITEDKRMTIEDKLHEYTNFMDTEEGQNIYNGCSSMIKEKLDKLTNFCDKVHSGDKLNREEQRELKRITSDVENIILDYQKK